MSWAGYVEALSALTTVDGRAEQAVQRLQDRFGLDQQAIEQAERDAVAAARSRAERLDAFRAELAAVPGLDDDRGDPIEDVDRPSDEAAADRRIGQLEQQVAQAVAAQVSLRRSLQRLQAQRPAAAPVPVPAPPVRRHRPAELAIAAIVLVLVLGFLILRALGI